MMFEGYNKLEISSLFAEKRFFGAYKSPNDKHEGVDLAGLKKTRLFAEAEGRVSDKQNLKDTYGKCLLIDTDLSHISKELDGCILTQLYGHLYDFSRSYLIGDTVRTGDIIGLMGNSGYCVSGGKRISIDQQNDENCQAGVHTHLTFRTADKQAADFFEKQKQGSVIFQWGRYYIDPTVVVRTLKAYL